jgi:hypothetical protein
VFQLSSCFTLLCTTTFSVSSYSQQSDAARPGGGQALARHGGSDRCSDGPSAIQGSWPLRDAEYNSIGCFAFCPAGPRAILFKSQTTFKLSCFQVCLALTRRQELPPPGRPTLGCQFRCIFRTGRDHYTTGTGEFKFKKKNIHLSLEP